MTPPRKAGRRSRSPCLIATAISLLTASVFAGSVRGWTLSDPGTSLAFQIDEGHNINTFVRDGQVAAHLVLRSGKAPRILVAFPAGDSGVALWFAKTDIPVTWKLAGPARAVALADDKGRPLRGIEAETVAQTSTLSIDRALLSSVRVLRDYQSTGVLPPGVLVEPIRTTTGLTWARDRLDGAPGYLLSVEALEGATVTSGVIRASQGEQLHLKIRALTGEQPLTPLQRSSLLTGRAGADLRAQEALEFLSYRQKYLAGSWRFATYFGRDTLISLALLAPVLRPVAIESGIDSVLARLSPAGRVAHEEEIGEFAILHNMKSGRDRSDAPSYDYDMVDEDFLLAPVCAGWLLDTAEGRARAPAFLAGLDSSGVRRGDALVRNFLWVLERTAHFATDGPGNLIGIKAGRMAGQWRDSDEGLGGGRYPYDVNVVFVPAALQAIARLLRSSLLDPYLSPPQRGVLVKAQSQAGIWAQRTPALFIVALPAERAKAEVAAYAHIAGVDPRTALASLETDTLEFDALALDDAGRPVPVMHSDEGFNLLFGTPSFAQLERAIVATMRPFPAGLLTPVGLLISNPAFATPAIQASMSRTAYHGTVIWSWQQAVFVAGLDRQLARTDLSPILRGRLSRARSLIWSSIEAAGELRTSELWSWSYANGCYRAEPFGQRGTDEDESNAVQLWSTVFLALSPPRGNSVTRTMAHSGNGCW
jgi:glycogen debranching enzyme